jgi:hypothetical protein
MTTPSNRPNASDEEQTGISMRSTPWRWLERAADAATTVSALLATKGGQAAAFIRAFDR